MYWIVNFCGCHRKRNYQNCYFKKKKKNHSPYVEYKDNKSQYKNNDNSDYFTVDLTIFNSGSFDTSCNKKEIYEFIFFPYV